MMKKKRKSKSKSKLSAAIFSVLAICSGLIFSYKNDLLPNTSKLKGGSVSNANVNVHVIDVGQADSILIESNGEYMMIDGGTTDAKDTILNYLKEQNVDKFKYVIGTHPHEDHIGSLDKVIDAYPVEKVFLPNVTHTSKTYKELLTSIQNKNLKITTPRVRDKYDLGEVSFEIVGPDENADYGTNYNDWSIIVKLIDGDISYILSGDAEKAAESDALKSGVDLNCDVYKAGHHGSRTASNDEFLNAMSPKYALISCGKGNKYNHPHQETLDKFKNHGIEYYRTDEKGTIIASSDGKNVTVNSKK